MKTRLLLLLLLPLCSTAPLGNRGSWDSCLEEDYIWIGEGLNNNNDNNYYGKTASAGDCQKLCWDTNGCQWFNWAAQLGCFLKKAKGSQKQDKPNSVTGPRSCSSGRCQVVVGRSDSNIREVTVDEECVCPAEVNGEWHRDQHGRLHRDQFQVSQNGGSLQVRRKDTNTGWEMHLVFMCELKVAGAPNTGGITPTGSCSVSAPRRSQCGWDNIEANHCRAIDCCYDPRAITNKCFYNRGSELLSVSAHGTAVHFLSGIWKYYGQHGGRPAYKMENKGYYLFYQENRWVVEPILGRHEHETWGYPLFGYIRAEVDVSYPEDVGNRWKEVYSRRLEPKISVTRYNPPATDLSCTSTISTLSSNGYRYYKRKLEKDITKMEVVQQLSSSLCTKDVSFGFKGREAWVAKGCRAKFHFSFCTG